MDKRSKLKLVFYGDDITGSTDAMEALVLAGVSTVLFLEPPTPEQVSENFPDIQAVGLAGISRTMTPEEMDAALPGAFSSLKALGAPTAHYKVCSTFDSSSEIGSIGRALEIGKNVFRSAWVPVAVGAPKLKRFVVFGNHFAKLHDQTYRLDRHPVMSKHPVTPMDESDLRVHLGKQTDLSIGLLDVLILDKPDNVIDSEIQDLLARGVGIIVLDTLDRSHLLKVGRLLTDLRHQGQSFVVGSSGVEFALTEYWGSLGKISPPGSYSSSGPVDQVVAMSGSASPHTALQIKRALEQGFVGIQIQTDKLVDPAQQETERNRLITRAVESIQNKKSVILYSTLGPDDSMIAATKEKAKSLCVNDEKVGEVLGIQQGKILKEILILTRLKRAAVAGGDTCGHVMKQLSIYVLEFIIPLGTAAPLCRASSNDPNFDQIEIALKGGQLGNLDFFSSLKNGVEI